MNEDKFLMQPSVALGGSIKLGGYAAITMFAELGAIFFLVYLQMHKSEK